ncbi:MAG TPA: VTT domain-containing protein [Actinomycetota bacterium]|nr:VTT domain-containing protein [Actinomycetota bacterium]
METSTWRRILLALGIARVALAVIAIPLVPVLFEDHFLWLVLMRPTKELFLAGGFLVRREELNLVLLVLASIPLSIFGAWLFYFLGRTYSKEIESGHLPPLVDRLLDEDKIKRFAKALHDKGPRLIFLGRLAVMSSAAVAAAAGAVDLPPRKFFPVDLAGGLLSIAYTIAAGYFLGEAYERAGPWLTGVGVVAFMGFAWILGRALKKD